MLSQEKQPKKLTCNAGPAFREIVLEFETPVECGNGHIHHELAELIPG